MQDLPTRRGAHQERDRIRMHPRRRNSNTHVMIPQPGTNNSKVETLMGERLGISWTRLRARMKRESEEYARLDIDGYTEASCPLENPGGSIQCIWDFIETQ